MVQKIIRAQRRRQRTRRDGALMAVMVFEPERLLPQIGQAGLNDLYIQLARRMQRHTGAVNPAGRYYDRCFVVLLETMHSPRWIRTLGLRVASSLRRPMDVPSLSGRRIRVTPDIAVGIVHLSAADKDVDQLLHEAQAVAEAARGMRSRAAMLDPETHAAVPVEHAELGSSWRALRNAAKPAASSNASRGKSGGAQGYFEAAIAAGADAFITGEISEPQAHYAREMGVAFIACGHHASERYGAPAMAAHVAAQLGLAHEFIDIDNPA